MAELWWSEAERYQVLPLNNQPGRSAATRATGATRYEFFDGVGPIPEAAGAQPEEPPVRHRRRCSTCRPRATSTGVIVAHGGHAGGYVLYVKDRRLHYTYNFVALDDRHGLRVGRAAGRPGGGAGSCSRRAGRPGQRRRPAQLYYDDVPVGEGEITRTTPITYGTHGFAVGFQPARRHRPRPPRPGRDARRRAARVVEVSGKDPVRDAMMDATATPRPDASRPRHPVAPIANPRTMTAK